ncbi:MAG: PAS domain S-box protein, partial [Lentisphaerae bacterium]|nr:PAS domain S-box protein [Lentisphaerota bacterium]
MADNKQSGQTIRITIPADRLSVLEAGKKAVPLPETAPPVRPALQNKLGSAEFSIYQQLLECNYDAVIVTDWNGGVVDGNIRVSEFFQYQPAELIGINITNVIYGFEPAVLDQIRDNLNNSRFTFIEAYCFRKDKTSFPAEIATGKLILGRENHLCFFVRDISLRKKAEEALDKTRAQLARVERLELAGSVAGHIAHDFNNLLTPLLVYPGFIKEQLPADSQAWNDLTVIEKTAQQIADINQQLLALSRRGYFEQTVLGINDIIEDVVALLTRGGLASGITIRAELAPDLFRIKGASEQLLRVIQNLCQNAIDAMAENGTLTIETHNVYLEAPLKNHPTMAIGEYIIVRLTDTGHGIPENIQDKIFDPFFTTK